MPIITASLNRPKWRENTGFVQKARALLRNLLRSLRSSNSGSAQTLRKVWTSALMRRSLTVFCALLFSACAINRSESSSALSRKAASANERFVISGKRIFGFDLARQQVRVAGLEERLDQKPWQRMASPAGMFRAVQVFPGPYGHAFVLDGVGKRICLYDTAAQFQSCLPLPDVIAPLSPDRLQIIAREDGRFFFLASDLGAGWIFREARASDNQTRWELILKVAIPSGLGFCLEKPFLETPCCILQNGIQCFDSFLSQLPLPDSLPELQPGPNKNPLTIHFDGGRRLWKVILSSSDSVSLELCSANSQVLSGKMSSGGKSALGYCAE